jgi:hypothetical protein
MGRKTPAASDAPPMAMEILRPRFFLFPMQMKERKFLLFF